MDYPAILEHLAPCGLDCSRCVYYVKSDVKTHAAELKQALTDYEKVVPAHAKAIAPVLSGYDTFKAILDHFAAGECITCRNGAPCFEFCAARTCHKEKGVDFCFQCAEFPCDKNHYPGSLDRRWREFGARMKEVGVEQFYEESLFRPRYE